MIATPPKRYAGREATIAKRIIQCRAVLQCTLDGGAPSAADGSGTAPPQVIALAKAIQVGLGNVPAQTQRSENARRRDAMR